jgi:TetR/AcrR family transcriptional regulator, cholesterol catabolism regulator
VEIKERILVGVEELFMRYGVKSMTMDDIAQQLSVSKKTIYQHFKDKNELVESVLQNHMRQERTCVMDIKSKSANAIEEIFLMSKHMKQGMMDMNPSLIFDIQKFHQEAWIYFREHKHEIFTQNIIDNLKWGIAEKYYRQEIDPEILGVFRVEQIELGFNSLKFSTKNYTVLEIQLELLNHFIHGIVTPLGLQKYNEYIQNNA